MNQNDIITMPATDDGYFSTEYIIDSLRTFNSVFPTRIVQAAVNCRKEITPKLLKFLDYACQNHTNLDQGYFGHTYAMFLLAEFRETTAFSVILNILELPTESLDLLLGDCLTEDYHNIIASVYNGNLEKIKQVIEKPNIDQYARDAAVCSMLTLYKESVIARNDVIDYFKYLFNNTSFISYPEAITHLVCRTCDLHPAELFKEIQNAFKLELVDTDIITINCVERDLNLDPDKVQLYTHNRYGYIKNTIESMDWWACFQTVKPKTAIVKKKMGRNDPCVCGSGKKFKKCCLLS